MQVIPIRILLTLIWILGFAMTVLMKHYRLKSASEYLIENTILFSQPSLRFVFEGLGTLMEHLLISNARYIRFANAVGIQKIMRNMLAMQQNMKTITDVSQDADFEKAKTYYSLFNMHPRVSTLFL